MVQTSEARQYTTKKPNNAFILSNSSCCEVLSEANNVENKNGQKFFCRMYEHAEPDFTDPFSRIVGAVFVCLARRILQFTCNQYIRTTVEHFVNKRNAIYCNAREQNTRLSCRKSQTYFTI